MPKEDIVAGLKQAVERGENLEQAKQSFINAGYDAREVEEAASSFGGVLTQYPQQVKPTPTAQLTPTRITKPSTQPTKPIQPQPKKLPTKPEKKPRKKLAIVLIVILILLLVMLGLSYIFRDKIIDFFTRPL